MSASAWRCCDGWAYHGVRRHKNLTVPRVVALPCSPPGRSTTHVRHANETRTDDSRSDSPADRGTRSGFAREEINLIATLDDDLPTAYWRRAAETAAASLDELTETEISELATAFVSGQPAASGWTASRLE